MPILTKYIFSVLLFSSSFPLFINGLFVTVCRYNSPATKVSSSSWPTISTKDFNEKSILYIANFPSKAKLLQQGKESMNKDKGNSLSRIELKQNKIKKLEQYYFRIVSWWKLYLLKNPFRSLSFFSFRKNTTRIQQQSPIETKENNLALPMEYNIVLCSDTSFWLSTITNYLCYLCWKKPSSFSIGKVGIKQVTRPEQNIKIVTLNYIYIKPEFRNYGYGKIALKQLEQKFPSSLMMLNVDDNGTGKLFKYYEEQGYTPLYNFEENGGYNNKEAKNLVILKKLL